MSIVLSYIFRGTYSSNSTRKICRNLQDHDTKYFSILQHKLKHLFLTDCWKPNCSREFIEIEFLHLYKLFVLAELQPANIHIQSFLVVLPSSESLKEPELSPKKSPKLKIYATCPDCSFKFKSGTASKQSKLPRKPLSLEMRV